jgi:hypothetical protein
VEGPVNITDIIQPLPLVDPIVNLNNLSTVTNSTNGTLSN